MADNAKVVAEAEEETKKIANGKTVAAIEGVVEEGEADPVVVAVHGTRIRIADRSRDKLKRTCDSHCWYR